MPLTLDQLKQIMPNARDKAGIFLGPLNLAMKEFGITESTQRVAMFLAQIAHESGEFRHVRELGSDAYLEKYDTGPIATRLGNTPADDGDGQRYRGRGLIQITGHDNYARCGAALGLPLLERPELLENPVNACRSAAWFWGSKGLNALADKGAFDAVTARINGGQNGREARREFWFKALSVLEVK
ncbi:chitinase class I family protein [Pseudogulbenkiania sp. NH8B]|uniref:glycoside hydrolase family 19 protein n=1 Tax=Pseudogulbenkiania sp. (strain NH8B) TaxID=748280 RepID=UPI0002279B01|nr:glycoside hydrolase family 19 protein [Pseudogulbenkiania sp. NH8B]BAK75830.1 chitinase class I family protein [Pseudogulbenkiania sp. NH8B]